MPLNPFESYNRNIQRKTNTVIIVSDIVLQNIFSTFRRKYTSAHTCSSNLIAFSFFISKQFLRLVISEEIRAFLRSLTNLLFSDHCPTTLNTVCIIQVESNVKPKAKNSSHVNYFRISTLL